MESRAKRRLAVTLVSSKRRSPHKEDTTKTYIVYLQVFYFCNTSTVMNEDFRPLPIEEWVVSPRVVQTYAGKTNFPVMITVDDEDMLLRFKDFDAVKEYVAELSRVQKGFVKLTKVASRDLDTQIDIFINYLRASNNFRVKWGDDYVPAGVQQLVTQSCHKMGISRGDYENNNYSRDSMNTHFNEVARNNVRSKMKPCAVCGNPTNLCCSQCEHISYCSPKCQKQHKKEHKTTCQVPSNKNN